MDTNSDLTEQLRLNKLKRRATSQGSKSPKGTHGATQSIKHISTTPKATRKPISFSKNDFMPQPMSGSKPRKADLDGSIDNKSRPKMKRINSAMLTRVDKERMPTEANLKRRISNENSPKPSKQKGLIHSYLAKKSKSPSLCGGGATKGGIGKSGSNKNFSFTTINNISMQNLINRNLSNYQMFLNKTYLGALKDSPGYPPQSPSGASVSGIFQNTAKGSCLFPSQGLNHSSGGGSKDNQTPNFQKKLKKYINKRENVLKRATNHG